MTAFGEVLDPKHSDGKGGFYSLEIVNVEEAAQAPEYGYELCNWLMKSKRCPEALPFAEAILSRLDMKLNERCRPPMVRYLLLFARVNLGVRDFQRAEELTMRAFQIFSKHPADDAVSRSMLHDCTEVMEEVLVAQKKAKEEKRRTNERVNVLATLESGWGDPTRPNPRERGGDPRRRRRGEEEASPRSPGARPARRSQVGAGRRRDEGGANVGRRVHVSNAHRGADRDAALAKSTLVSVVYPASPATLPRLLACLLRHETKVLEASVALEGEREVAAAAGKEAHTQRWTCTSAHFVSEYTTVGVTDFRIQEILADLQVCFPELEDVHSSLQVDPLLSGSSADSAVVRREESTTVAAAASASTGEDKPQQRRQRRRASQVTMQALVASSKPASSQASVDMEDIPQQSCTVVTLRAGERATLLHDVAQCLREEFFEVPSLSYTLQGGEVNLVARVRDRLAHSPVAIGQRPMLRQLLIFAATGAVPTEHKLKRAALSDMKAVQQYLTPPKARRAMAAAMERQVAAFASLPLDADKAAVLDAVATRGAVQHTLLASAGQPGSHFGLIQEGTVTVQSDGGEAPAIAPAGVTLGELDLELPTTMPATVHSASACSISTISWRVFRMVCLLLGVPDRRHLFECIRAAPAFKHVEGLACKMLAEACWASDATEELKQGKELPKCNPPRSGYMYLVTSGRIMLSTPTVDNLLPAKQVFGMDCLRVEEGATQESEATVLATEDATLMKIDVVCLQ